MSSVVGLDIGNYASKIGAARNRGVDILLNESSARATPTLVGFSAVNRSLGEGAKTAEISNLKNTVASIKRLIGRRADDPEVKDVESKFLTSKLVDVNGEAGVEVNYLGKPTQFSATELYAMYLGRLRDTAALELKAAVNDVVIAVPGWYTDVQRRAVRDAAEVANLNPLRLINDTTATALGYGITKTDLPEPDQKPRNIVFVDIGHSDYSVAIVSFSKGQLTVRSTAYDRNFGGRDFDLALVNYFAEEFKAKYKIDVWSNQKAQFRLIAAVEKLKKILSANAVAPISVESIMNDVDASSSIKREVFEELIAPLLDRTLIPLQQALGDAKISRDDIDAVELVGGSTRIPALKTRIQEFFGRPPSFTCNQDEAIARGATLACAILSPIFKVRDFTVNDIQPYPIDITWEAGADVPDEGTSLRTFERLNPVPSTKNLSFHRKGNFALSAQYADPTLLPGSISPTISTYNIPLDASSEYQVVKIKARLNLDGILSWEGASLTEEVDDPSAAAAAPAADADAMETDGQPAKKKKLIKRELKGVASTASLTRKRVDEFTENEAKMHAHDKLVAETEERKNALEEYIYDIRDKLDGTYSAYAPADVKDKLKAASTAAEDWLYSEEGEDATKSAYVAKLDELKKLGDPIAFRVKEAIERPAAEKQLRQAISTYMEQATSQDEKFAHIGEADRTKVVEAVATAEKWLSDQGARQAERRKSDEPAITSIQILKKREDIIATCNPIMTKPKPKAPNPPPTSGQQPPKEPQPEAAPEAAADEAVPELEPDAAAQPEQKETNMDVD